MRTPMRPLLIALAVVLHAASAAEAVSIVSAEATLDWTGFTFTTTGTLAVTGIYPAGHNETPWTQTTGSATAAASTTNGFLAATAGAVTTGGEGFPNVGQASASAYSIFSLYGTGSGSLVVTLPYRLEVTSVETDALDITNASAAVRFFTGPGVGSNDDWFASDALALVGAGTLSRVGVLTASRPFSNPTWGPLVFLNGQAEARAVAAVPEPTTLLLVGVGLVGILGARRLRRI